MDKKRANAKYSDEKKNVELNVSIFLWNENSVFPIIHLL